MMFHSTRGLADKADFRTVALTGLAPDGGLYLPQEWPHFSAADIGAMRGKPYEEIAFQVMKPFTGGAFANSQLQEIIGKAYGAFAEPEVTPLREIEDGLYVLELFHGPTLAFKDIAMQFLGNVFEAFLKEADRRTAIVGATSGDTGSAAMAALADRKNVDVFILYPDKGPSDIQRKQMTCVDAPNVHAIAIKGSFDDCQSIVKALFADRTFRSERTLSTINSINWLRILAQIVYYFVAAQKIGGAPSFVVPTGNFGDVFAGYAAAKCGLPVGKLVVASNSNDILTRFFATGRMKPEGVQATLSPSMDIQISSNFERLLFDLCDGDAATVRRLMEDLKTGGEFCVTEAQLAQAKTLFAAASATDEETVAVIRDIYQNHGYVLDPHTAVGVKAARELQEALSKPVVCLATAHPAKFPQTIESVLGFAPAVPPKTAALIRKPERTMLLEADAASVAAFILNI